MRVRLGVLASMAVMAAVGSRAEAQLAVRLAHDSEAERQTRDEILRLVAEYDVAPWIHTWDILIDENAIPHSHPVLTLHTRDVGDEALLLSTFLHEQFHWLEDGATLDAFRAAMDDFAELYPDAPGRSGGGARDVESTYRHLVVCDFELQAMTKLLGAEEARDLLAGITHYEWIYQRVLSDERVREVNARHGFVVN